MLVFSADFLFGTKEVCHAQEAIFGRADRGRPEAGGTGIAGGRPDPAGRHLGAGLRDECLNLHWFETIAEAKRLIEAWRREYNESRPHMALGNRTPQEYALRISPSPLAQGSGAGES